jgi:hypothetical protein
MTVHADYLIQDEGEQRVRDGIDWLPEFSRRARAFPVYAPPFRAVHDAHDQAQ